MRQEWEGKADFHQKKKNSVIGWWSTGMAYFDYHTPKYLMNEAKPFGLFQKQLSRYTSPQTMCHRDSERIIDNATHCDHL